MDLYITECSSLMDILEQIGMALMHRLEKWLMHRIANLIQPKWHGRDAMTHANYLDKLRVIHKSEHFLAVNKHPDLVINTNPGDNRWVPRVLRVVLEFYKIMKKGQIL